MIPRSPLERQENANFSWLIRHFLALTRVVPHARKGANHKLLGTDNKGNSPEESKQEVPAEVLEFLFSFDIGDEGFFFELGFTDTKEVDCSDDPVNHENHTEHVSYQWQNYDSNVLGNKYRGALHDRSSEGNVLVTATHADQVGESYNPSGNCSVL